MSSNLIVEKTFPSGCKALYDKQPNGDLQFREAIKVRSEVSGIPHIFPMIIPAEAKPAEAVTAQQ